MPVHSVLALVPSARGVLMKTVSCLWDARTVVEKAGHRMSLGGLDGVPLDLARNELDTAFRAGSDCDIAWLLDDDVQVDVEWFRQMLNAFDAGARIISMPCRMRNEGNLFNVIPMTAPYQLGGLRVVDCAWTGLGSVLIHREVSEKLYKLAAERSALAPCKECGHQARETYQSTAMPQHTSAATFRSEVVPARQLFVEAPADMSVYTLDDKIFSMKTLAAGFKIHAAIDVPTWHRELSGTFGAEMERFDRERRQAAERGKKLVGVDGKRL
jgi:hypothetical protein